VGLESRWMPAAYRAVTAEGVAVLVVKDSATLVSERENLRGATYTVFSDLAPDPDMLSDAQRAATESPLPTEIRDSTALPSDFPGDVRRLAEEIVSGAANPYERARALEQFFLDPAQGFTYSLEVDLGPTAQSKSAIREFVRERRVGFCVQFAGSYAAMARAVGLPARVAVGYTPGDFDPDRDEYIVTTHNAHAWPEVWLEGLGWTRFEPTPPAPGLPGGSDEAGVVTPGAGDEPAPAPTAAGTPTTVAAGPAPTVAALPDARVSVDARRDERADRDRLLTFSGAVLAILGAGAVLSGLTIVVVIVVAKARRRARRRARADPADAIAGAWEEAIDRLGEAGVDAPPSLTPFELATRARDTVPERVTVRLRSLAETYTETCYGPTPLRVEDATAAWADVDRLTHELAARASLRERLRRRLDPSPLRAR
jgi:transglutaminase-like putative cysteine protease